MEGPVSRAPARIIAIGAASAGLAVALGAFGAHALQSFAAAELLDVFETGVRYHLYHSLALLGIGVFAGQRRDSRPLRFAAVLMITGMVFFSGSLYTMVLTGWRWLGAVTPLGGVAFLAGWAVLAWEAGRHSAADSTA